MLISVFVPCFNYGKYVEEALDSVASQGLQGLQLIIVDDQSTDDSEQVIRRWVQAHESTIPIIFERNEENMGVAASTNRAIALAGGRYFTHLDADDALAPGVLKAHCDVLDAEPAVGVVHGDVVYTSENLHSEIGPYMREPFRDSQALLALILRGSVLPVVGSVIRTDLLRSVGGVDVDAAYQDWPLWLKLAQVTDFRYSGVFAGHYRKHGHSLSDTRARAMRLTRVECLRRLLADDQLEHRFRRAATKRVRTISLEMWAGGDGAQAAHACRKVVRERFDPVTAFASFAIAHNIPHTLLRRIVRRVNVDWWP